MDEADLGSHIAGESHLVGGYEHSRAVCCQLSQNAQHFAVNEHPREPIIRQLLQQSVIVPLGPRTTGAST